MIKTVTTTTGVNVINFGNTADRYYWCKNIGETTLYVSAKENIVPDADDVAMLESGDIVMIETYNQDIYVLGEGKIQIYETETNVCPFKVGGKGGEVPDLSAYAKTADVPNIKVNSAVDADSVGGFTADLLLKTVANSNTLTTSIDTAYAVGTFAVEASFTPDFPVGYGTYGFLDVRAYGAICYQTVRFETGIIISRAAIVGQSGWTKWAEIYTSGNKPYVTGSATVEANSDSCVTNHGFMPSAAMWWTYDFMAHFPLSYSENSLNFENPFSEDTIISYMIFK